MLNSTLYTFEAIFGQVFFPGDEDKNDLGADEVMSQNCGLPFFPPMRGSSWLIWSDSDRKHLPNALRTASAAGLVGGTPI